MDSGAWDRPGDRKTALLSKSADRPCDGRHEVADDVVNPVMWLLRAGFVTGETIHIEGGARHKSA
ncbi:hypothetical protein ABZ619_24325 [Streptomyces sp. NPDC007851]|uniref:hypothetical protein n=1 Tax=Streptomyces sp. NPDC007851 TaxID=3155008 RepID=UPI00340233AD